ncbi:MAG TPA: ABC transporter permease [Halothiobacillaceae bacterium]|nr:ABC transporter permease [Halothiobacillaceae bacterium]
MTQSTTESTQARIRASIEDERVLSLYLEGHWRLADLQGHFAFEQLINIPTGVTKAEIRQPPQSLDSAGALEIARLHRFLQQQGIELKLSGLQPQQQGLAALLIERNPPEKSEHPHQPGFLASIGLRVFGIGREMNAFLAFLGELAARGLPAVLAPWRIRWREVAGEIQAAGVRALGIVGLLSFLIGMVMAYQAGATLADFGANILIVNLVAIITLREMGPLITAIIVAGRTGSSYTAQIGTMKITEEVDALKAIGIPPFSMLILPKVIALMIVLPLLTLFANLMGLAGGALVAAQQFEVPVRIYIDRLPEVVDLTTLMLGLVKAPVFAITIALIGCMQGMRVSGSAAAVGRATTKSVVQAIFLVIVIDAVFSVAFNILGY